MSHQPGRGGRRTRTVGTKLVMGSIAVVLCLLSMELAAWALEPQVPLWRSQRRDGTALLTGHPTRLWAMAPGRYEIEGVSCTIGEDGLRGDGAELPRPPERQRILLLGDSSWFGHGVSDDMTLAVQLEERLADSGISVDVVNGGVPGYSTEQTRIQLDEIGWDYQPTLLLIANLWSDNSFDAHRDADLLTAVSSGRVALLGRSALFRWLAISIDRLRGGEGARILSWPSSPAWSEAGHRRVPVRSYASNLDGMIRDARERGIGAALLAPGNVDIVKRGLHLEAAWQGYFEAQEKVAAHHGVPVVRGYEALIATETTLGINALFTDDLHPSAIGHAVIAGATERSLTAAGWPDRPLLGIATPFDPSTLSELTAPNFDDVPPRGSPQSHLFESPSSPATDLPPPEIPDR